MFTALKMINAAALMVLFFDYAVAMEKVEPMGMRRCLQTISKQLPTGSFPALKPVWELGVKMADQV